MIRFKQKNYAAPLVAAMGGTGLMNALTAGGLAMTGIQMHQASNQAKEAEQQQQEALRAQKKENEKLTKALNNIASSAKNNPQVALQAGHMVGQSKMFAVPSTSSILSKGRRVVSDMFRVAGGKGKVAKSVIGLGMAGLATGATMYGLDKVQTADARRIGMMPRNDGEQPQQRSYAAPTSIMSKVGNYVKKAGKIAVSKDVLKQAGGWAAFGGGLAGLGYISDRAAFKGQQEAQQRSYTVNISSMMRGVKGYLNPKNIVNSAKGVAKDLNPKNWQILKTPGKTTTGFISRMGSMGMIGRKDIGNFAGRLINDPKSSDLSKKIGGWMLAKDKAGNFIKDSAGNYVSRNRANLAVGLGAGSVLTGAYGMGEKAVKKTAKALDKDAYAYENFKNQQVQQ